ncbi:MAG: hypothetical protein HYZ81_06245 [Nitrospinae bacterium]|nr:hypothetical protein [Nitrospinota bacterium]
MAQEPLTGEQQAIYEFLDAWRCGEELGGEFFQVLVDTTSEPGLRQGFQMICDREWAHANGLKTRLLELKRMPQQQPTRDETRQRRLEIAKSNLPARSKLKQLYDEGDLQRIDKVLADFSARAEAIKHDLVTKYMLTAMIAEEYASMRWIKETLGG